MVQRDRDYNNPPDGFNDAKWDATRNQALVDEGAHEAKKALYRDVTKEDLFELYCDKCAYCERTRGFELEIDHYRPTKTRDFQSNLKWNQPGYYWLAYVWSNLLPLCSKCNNLKSNKFPLRGHPHENRILNHVPVNPHTLANINDLIWLNNHENPGIIHPELEPNPEKHFKFLNNGRIRGRTFEGRETIHALELDRRDLRIERKRIINKIADDINNELSRYLDDGDEARLRGGLGFVFRNIVEGCDIDHPFSMLHVFIYKYFEYYIGSHLPNNVIVKKSIDFFEEFKRSNQL